MPLLSVTKKETFDPLSDKTESMIREIHQGIDRFKLRDFAYERSARLVVKRLGIDYSGSFLNLESFSASTRRIIQFQVELEYTCELRNLIADFVSVCKYTGVPSAISPEENKARIDTLISQYDGVFSPEAQPETRDNQEVDMPVETGGLTRLHIAAQNGDLEEVKRLVEVEKAKTGLRDNSNYTPKDRAVLMGHDEVVYYLSNFS